VTLIVGLISNHNISQVLSGYHKSILICITHFCGGRGGGGLVQGIQTLVPPSPALRSFQGRLLRHCRNVYINKTDIENLLICVTGFGRRWLPFATCGLSLDSCIFSHRQPTVSSNPTAAAAIWRLTGDTCRWINRPKYDHGFVYVTPWS